MRRACIANKCREGRDACHRAECFYIADGWWARFLRWLGSFK